MLNFKGIKINKSTNSQKNKKEKVFKIKSETSQKIGRIVLWTLIAFLCIRGIGSILRGNVKIDIDQKMNAALQANSEKVKFTKEAASFAEAFSIEYLTYKQGESEGYQQRLSKYMPSYLSVVDNIGGNQVQAMDAITFRTENYTDNQINVDVKVKAKYLISGAEKIKDVFIRVPILRKDNKYVVEDLPVFIPEPGIANSESKIFEGKVLEDNETTKIKEMIGSFLKVYCEGSPNEINYYMYDSNTKISVLNGQVKFKAIDDVKAFKGEDSNISIVIVSYRVEDPDSNQIIKQDMHLKLVKKDGRYYIKEFNTRIGNLVESGRYK